MVTGTPSMNPITPSRRPACAIGRDITMDLDAVLTAEGPLWDQLYERLAGLSDKNLVTPLVDEWSAEDILFHLTRWHDHACDAIEAMTTGREPLSRHDDFNDWNAEDRERGVDDARRIALQLRRALMDCVAGLPPEQRRGEWVRWLHANTQEHYSQYLSDLPELGRAPIAGAARDRPAEAARSTQDRLGVDANESMRLLTKH